MTLAASLLVWSAGFFAERVGFVDRAPRTHPESARYTERRHQPLEFAAGFRSYQTQSEAQARIATTGAVATVTGQHLPPSRNYPPRDLDTVRLDGFASCGTTGLLTLEFFNDRLLEMRFEPADAARCAADLRSRYPAARRDRNGRIDWSAGGLRYANNLELAESAVGEALRVTPYVVWQDLRLTSARDEWDRRFGARPLGAP